MESGFLELLSKLPWEIVLFYLIVRQQGQIEKLLASIIENERIHARQLFQIACGKPLPGDESNSP